MSKTAFVPQHRLAVCPQCENLFAYVYTGRRAQKYCSKRCSGRYLSKPHVRVPQVEVPCEQCGSPFMRSDGAVHRRFCSGTCSATYRRLNETPEAAERRRESARRTEQRPERRAYGKAKKRARRARVKGVRSEIFTPDSIHERDAWRCQLCRCKVHVTDDSRDPRQATIDHIVPLSKGGAHSPTNCQTACRKCNCQKHTKAAGQFRLF